MDGSSWATLRSLPPIPAVPNNRRPATSTGTPSSASTSNLSLQPKTDRTLAPKKSLFFGRKRPSTASSSSSSSSGGRRLAPIPGSPPGSSRLAREYSAPSMLGHPTMLLSRSVVDLRATGGAPPPRPVRPTLSTSESAPAGLATLAGGLPDELPQRGRNSEEENERSLRELWEITGAYEAGWDASLPKHRPDFSAPASMPSEPYSLSPLHALPDTSPLLRAPPTPQKRPLEIRLDSPNEIASPSAAALEESPTLPRVELPSTQPAAALGLDALAGLSALGSGPDAIKEVEKLLRSLGLEGYELVPKGSRKSEASGSLQEHIRAQDPLGSARHSIASSIGSNSTGHTSLSRERDARLFTSQFAEPPTPPCRGSSLKPSSKPLPSSASVVSLSSVSVASDTPKGKTAPSVPLPTLGSPLRLPARGSSKGKGKRPAPIGMTSLARVNSSPDLRKIQPTRFEETALEHPRPSTAPDRDGQRRATPVRRIPLVRRTKSQPDLRADIDVTTRTRWRVAGGSRTVSAQQTRSAANTPATEQDATFVAFAGPSRAGSTSLRRSQRVTRQGSTSLSRANTQHEQNAAARDPVTPAKVPAVAARALQASPNVSDSDPEELFSMLETAKAWAWPAPPTPPPAIPLPPVPSAASSSSGSRLTALNKRAGTILIPGAGAPPTISSPLSAASFAPARSPAQYHAKRGSESSSTESHSLNILTPPATTETTVRSAFPPSATLPALSIFDELTIIDHEAAIKRDMSDRAESAAAAQEAAHLPPLDFSLASGPQDRNFIVGGDSTPSHQHQLGKVLSNSSSIKSASSVSTKRDGKVKPAKTKKANAFSRMLLDGLMHNGAMM